MRKPWIAALAVSLAVPSARADEPSARGLTFEQGTTFEEALAAAKRKKAHVFLFFTMEGCGPCKRLERTTFSDPRAAKALEGVPCLRVQLETPEGERLCERYGVQMFPTLWIVDGEGRAVDQVAGFDVEGFVGDVARVLRGEDTLPVLRARLREHPDDVETKTALAQKLLYTAPAEAESLCKQILAGPNADAEARAEALVHVAIVAGDAERHEESMAALERVLAECSGTRSAARVTPLVQYFGSDPERGLAFLKRATDLSARHPGTDATKPLPDCASEALWLHRMAAETILRRRAEAAGKDADTLFALAEEALRHDLCRSDAPGWAARRAEAAPRDPAALDVLARLLLRRDDQGKTPAVLWLTGRDLDRAIVLEEEAVGKTTDPDARAEREETLAQMRAVKAVRAAHEKAAR